jgi:hypothetical protein
LRTLLIAQEPASKAAAPPSSSTQDMRQLAPLPELDTESTDLAKASRNSPAPPTSTQGRHSLAPAAAQRSCTDQSRGPAPEPKGLHSVQDALPLEAANLPLGHTVHCDETAAPELELSLETGPRPK